MNEAKNSDVNRHLKTEFELYFTLKSKNCDYRAIECPSAYNFHSSGDYTCFINFNSRTKLYDLYCSSNFKMMFHDYQPLNYGSKFDKLINGEYPEMRKFFIEMCRWEVTGFKKWRDKNELYKSIKVTDIR